MAGDTILNIAGNLTSDPELRFVPSGRAVCSFTVASTPRKFDNQTNEWKDEPTLFLRCSAWGDMAENAAETLVRGTRVMVSGRLKQRSYTDKEGTERTVFELDVDEVGPSLKSASAKVSRTARQGTQGAQQARTGGGDPSATAAPAASEVPF